MRTARVFLLALAAACAPRAPGEMSGDVPGVVGPLTLKGRHHAMMGPGKDVYFRFPRAGWITSLSAHVLDEKGRARDHDGLFCHAYLQKAGEGSPDPARATYADGVFEESLHLTLNEGQNDIRFPEGFGVRVDTAATYLLSSMLQSGDEANDGEYRFDVKRDFVPDGAGAPLRSLYDLMVRVEDGAGPVYCGGNRGFMVPPGRSVFETRFTLPYGARVHYMTMHLHNYARSVKLIDARTGKSVYQALTSLDGRGHLIEIPTYSSTEGFALKKGVRYVYRVEHDNPSAEAAPGMANLRMYIERRAGAAL